MHIVFVLGIILGAVDIVLLGAIFCPLWFAGCEDRRWWRDNGRTTACTVVGRKVIPPAGDSGIGGQVTFVYTANEDRLERLVDRPVGFPHPPLNLNDATVLLAETYTTNSSIKCYYHPTKRWEVRWELEDPRPFCDAAIVVGGLVLFVPALWSAIYAILMARTHWTTIRSKLPC